MVRRSAGEASVNDLDGVRLDWPDRWVHVRPSNTEPAVRVIAEAPTEKEADALCDEFLKLAQSVAE
jgi:phosphomannomutase